MTSDTHEHTTTTTAEAEMDAATMRAVRQHHYGGPEVFRLGTAPIPVPGAGQVRLRVLGAGVERGVWHQMTGRPYLARAAFGWRRPSRPVPGAEVSGVVDAVGPDVTRFAEGDLVFGTALGSFAEYTLAAEDHLAAVPPSIDPVDAAALGVSGSTALQAVEDRGGVEDGAEVLVMGASGGVGAFAVQVAVAAGARVTGVASGSKLDIVERLGASAVDYRLEDPLDGDRRYDLIVDTGGNRTLRDLRSALVPRGTLVVVGGEGGGRWIGGSDRQLRAVLSSRFVGQHLTTLVASEDAAHLERLADLVDAGRVAPVIDRRVTLVDVPDAMARLGEGRVRGKIVVDVAAASS